MNCRKVQNLISAYVDCELPGLEMLAVRQHLHECKECNAEFEITLRVKRTLGSLTAKRPSDQLAAQIIHQLDYVSIPAYEHLFSSIRKRMGVHSGRLGFAVATAGILAAMFIVRPGEMQRTDVYGHPSLGSIQIGSLVAEDSADTFSPSSVRTMPTRASTVANGIASQWGLYPQPDRPEALTGHASMLLTSYQ